MPYIICWTSSWPPRRVLSARSFMRELARTTATPTGSLEHAALTQDTITKNQKVEENAKIFKSIIVKLHYDTCSLWLCTFLNSKNSWYLRPCFTGLGTVGGRGSQRGILRHGRIRGNHWHTKRSVPRPTPWPSRRFCRGTLLRS